MAKKNIELNEDLEKLGKLIKELRVKKGHTNYEKFAYEAEIGRSQYFNYEKGTEDLRFTSLLRIIRALEMTPKQFFELWEE